MSIEIKFLKLKNDAIIPIKAHPTDSGFDLFSNEDVIIKPGETEVIKTGIAVGLPDGFEAQVRPRSGITSKTKLRVQLGTIDNNYIGDIGVTIDNIFYYDESYDGPPSQKGFLNIKNELINMDDERMRKGVYMIRKGDKLAQLVVQHLPKTTTKEVDELKGTDRGTSGFGDSGHSAYTN